ncbi:helix-hairpin-helix domain-containing protein [Micromonospora sp. R77]|uniref:ComEA family DNA-binding protein n=1 Tax=Micromonospora sp. R77 TaxID=2925836 RepID=UPI001F61772C|nr:helix-hairpin-helix domain-containing protein [Micromonospora sp. R77]MCI4062846.1 helix-hairpin-helix domain-containing protein [Micromonospora sp. R77]
MAGLGYLALVASVLFLALRSGNDEGTDAEAFYVVGALGFCWLVGAVHVVLISPAVWAAVRRLFGADDRRVTDERRVRREQARYLLHHYPAARYDLGIGRPDLPGVFDDGGLVDVNGVPDPVLATLPGLTPDQYQRVVADRWLHGPYASMEDLAGRCLLPAALTDSLRDLLLFLPPPPPPSGVDQEVSVPGTPGS